MFDIPLGIEYSAMSTECIPARNLLELVPPAIHDWQLVFTMWPKVDLDWFALFCMSSAHQSFSMWPKVGRARRTPHLVSICLRTFHPWRGKISFTNSGGRHFTVTLMRDLSRFWSPPTVQSNILASWSKNQKPFRMSEGDESDGNLGVLLIRTLDDTRYSSKIAISWCSCLATSRWWWIQNRSSISYLTKFPRCWRFFRKILAYIQKFSMPFHLAIQIVRTDHWSARTCWWTPEHCTRQYPCILIPEPFQDEWRWRKWRKFGSVAHSNFGWNEVLVENCHLLMQLSRHVKVMMDTS